MMEHRQAIIVNKIREALEALQRKGVGFIDCEGMSYIDYRIDDLVFTISVKGGEADE